jgi:hypothetical protein
MKKLVGKQEKGKRIYRREGSYKEAGVWFTELDEAFNNQFVSPGGVSMFVPVSRAAVYKRMKEGRLTAFCFHVVKEEKTFFGNVRKAKAAPFVCVPVSECKAWAKELEEKRGTGAEGAAEEFSEEFLVRAPEDRGQRGVRYTEKHLEKAQTEWIANEIEETRREKSKRGKKTS